MRLSHSDLIPLLVIMGGGAVSVVTSAALVLWLSSALVSAPVPAVLAPVPAVSESESPVAPPAWPAPAPVRLVWSRDGGSIVLVCREGDGDGPRVAARFFDRMDADGSGVYLRQRKLERFCLGPAGRVPVRARLEGPRRRR